jgi:hypothetical protein
MSKILLPTGQGSKRTKEAADDMAFDPMSAAQDSSALEATLLKTVGSVLERHYPAPSGLPVWWAVEVNESVINIFNIALSGRFGFILHVAGLTTDKVVKAGGEILERFGVARDTRYYTAEKIIQLHDENEQRYLKHHAG